METKYDFPIVLSPIKAGSIIIPNKSAVIREDTNQPIGIVSNKYGLLKHKDVIDSFREALKGKKFDERIDVVKNGAQMLATYSFKNIQYEVTKDDVVGLQFIAKNSYDRTKSFQLILGALRLVCTNGMVMGRQFFSFTQKHIASGIASIEMSMLQEKIGILTNKFKDSIPVMQAMSKLKLEEPNEGLFDQKNLFAHSLMIPNYLLKEAKESFYKDQEKTVWGFYNSLTYAITHKMKKEKPQAQIDYTNRAWDAAIEVMEG